MNIPKPIIPKEHGAWAVLLVPMLVGIGIAGEATVRFLWLALAALGVFLSYIPAQTVLRHFFVAAQHKEKLNQSVVWASLYLALGLICSVPLLIQGYILLIAVGMVGVAAFLCNFVLSRHHPKSIPGDLAAVVGLSLGAPSAYYVTTGVLDSKAVVLWVLNCLFFGSSVFYVHMKIRATTARKGELNFVERLSLGKLNLMYHTFAILVVVVLALYHQTRFVAAIAFIPMTVHAIYGTWKLTNRVKFKNLGFLLLGQSVVFAFVLWGALR